MWPNQAMPTQRLGAGRKSRVCGGDSHVKAQRHQAAACEVARSTDQLELPIVWAAARAGSRGPSALLSVR